MSAAVEIMPHGHLAIDRVVWTFLHTGQPEGVITGYGDGFGGLVVEHIIHWGRNVRRMLDAGLHDAWTQGWAYLVLAVPEHHPRGAGLRRLAESMGFQEYTQTPEAAWFVRYRP